MDDPDAWRAKGVVMAVKSPLQVVTDSFGGREKLVAELAGMVDDLNGDGGDLKARLSGLSNKKLLRLYQIEQKVRENYGDRAKLEDHIVEARAKAGLTADDNFRASLASHSKGRLLDLTRQEHGTRAEKQTPEQRLKSKRGRKQRERAQSKLASS